MRTADNHTQVHDLVPAMVNRLPAILAEVAAVLTQQQPDYAGFLAGDFQEILGAAEVFISRLVCQAHTTRRRWRPRWRPAWSRPCSRRSGAPTTSTNGT